MRRDQTQRIAQALGFVAVPRSGYITPETHDQIAREIEQTDAMIRREWGRRQAARANTEKKQMTDTKHTPGPWVRDCWDIMGSASRNGGGTGHVCEVSYPNGADDKFWHSDEADANARLIAAAPDMLEALESVLDEYELRMDGLVIQSIDKIRAAIAKARGGSK